MSHAVYPLLFRLPACPGALGSVTRGEAILMNVIRTTFNFFSEICFGCAHDRLSRPFSIEDQCYMVCLECGRHVPYSPTTMRPLTGREIRRMKAVQAAGLKVVPAAMATGPVLVPRGKARSTAA